MADNQVPVNVVELPTEELLIRLGTIIENTLTNLNDNYDPNANTKALVEYVRTHLAQMAVRAGRECRRINGNIIKRLGAEAYHRISCRLCGRVRPEMIRCRPQDPNQVIDTDCHNFCLDCVAENVPKVGTKHWFPCKESGHEEVKYIIGLKPSLFRISTPQELMECTRSVVKCGECKSYVSASEFAHHWCKSETEYKALKRKYIDIQEDLQNTNGRYDGVLDVIHARKSLRHLDEEEVAIIELQEKVMDNEKSIADLKKQLNDKTIGLADLQKQLNDKNNALLVAEKAAVDKEEELTNVRRMITETTAFVVQQSAQTPTASKYSAEIVDSPIEKLTEVVKNKELISKVLTKLSELDRMAYKQMIEQTIKLNRLSRRLDTGQLKGKILIANPVNTAPDDSDYEEMVEVTFYRPDLRDADGRPIIEPIKLNKFRRDEPLNTVFDAAVKYLPESMRSNEDLNFAALQYNILPRDKLKPFIVGELSIGKQFCFSLITNEERAIFETIPTFDGENVTLVPVHMAVRSPTVLELLNATVSPAGEDLQKSLTDLLNEESSMTVDTMSDETYKLFNEEVTQLKLQILSKLQSQPKASTSSSTLSAPSHSRSSSDDQDVTHQTLSTGADDVMEPKGGSTDSEELLDLSNREE